MAFPENPAAIDFARQKASDIRWQDEIAGNTSKAAQIDEQMKELYKSRWPAAGDRALYGSVGSTIRDKVDEGSLRV